MHLGPLTEDDLDSQRRRLKSSLRREVVTAHLPKPRRGRPIGSHTLAMLAIAAIFSANHLLAAFL